MLGRNQIIDDRYIVEDHIGQGGMANVYRVRHRHLGSQHALKVLFFTAPSVVKRMMKEGRAQAALQHPNVVGVTDVLTIDGAPGLVMEYVKGPTLGEFLASRKLDVAQALWLFRGIVNGVGAAHRVGIVHRDLKPSNVLLSPTADGIVPKVSDFGLVKSLEEEASGTMTGAALGTPQYMAPEQIRDASDVDARADVFALGCILYELVCGIRAFDLPNRYDTFEAILRGEYTDPTKHAGSLPRKVREAIGGTLEPDPAARMRDTGELLDLLYEDTGVVRIDELEAAKVRLTASMPEHLLRESTESVVVPMPSSPSRATWVAAGAVPGLALGLMLGVLGTLALRPTPEPVIVQVPTPAPQPVAVAAPAPAPAPVVEAAPEPAPIRAKRKAAAPTPEPVAESPWSGPPAGSGRVRVTGNAERVWLERGSSKHEIGDVPVGTYEVWAVFPGGGPVRAGSVTVVEGGELTLACSDFLQRCKRA